MTVDKMLLDFLNTKRIQGKNNFWKTSAKLISTLRLSKYHMGVQTTTKINVHRRKARGNFNSKFCSTLKLNMD
jgi:hypothetical protein